MSKKGKCKIKKIILKGLLLVLISVLLSSTFNTINVDASTQSDNQVNLIAKYDSKLSGNTTEEELVQVLYDLENNSNVNKISDKEKVDLVESVLSSVDDKVVQEYQQNKLDEISDIINYEVNPGDLYYEEEFKLSDGSSIVLSSEDASESLIAPFALEMGPYRNETKAYGDRRYTAWVKLKSLGVTVATLKLGNHYSVGTYGLKMRYCSIAGTNGTVLTNVDASCNVTDDKAEKVGYDMNATGTYKLTGKVNNGFIQLFSTIKLAQWDKTKKTVYVQQKYSYRD